MNLPKLEPNQTSFTAPEIHIFLSGKLNLFTSGHIFVGLFIASCQSTFSKNVTQPKGQLISKGLLMSSF